MAARKAILTGARRIIKDPRSTPLQILKAMRLYEQEKTRAAKAPSEVDLLCRALDRERTNA